MSNQTLLNLELMYTANSGNPISAEVLEQLAGNTTFAPLILRHPDVPFDLWKQSWQLLGSNPLPVNFWYGPGTTPPSMERIDYVVQKVPTVHRDNWGFSVPDALFHEYVQTKATTKGRRATAARMVSTAVLMASPDLMVERLKSSKVPLGMYGPDLLGAVSDDDFLELIRLSQSKLDDSFSPAARRMRDRIRVNLDVRPHLVDRLIEEVPDGVRYVPLTSHWQPDRAPLLVESVKNRADRDGMYRLRAAILHLCNNDESSAALRSAFSSYMNALPPSSPTVGLHYSHGVIPHGRINFYTIGQYNHLIAHTLVRAWDYASGLLKDEEVPEVWRGAVGRVSMLDWILGSGFDNLLGIGAMQFTGTEMGAELNRVAKVAKRREPCKSSFTELLHDGNDPFDVRRSYYGPVSFQTPALSRIKTLSLEGQVLAWNLVASEPNSPEAWDALVDSAASICGS